MSRKICRRKHYALVNPIALALEGASTISTAKADKLRMLELSAIDAFARGHASLADWRSVADMSNVAQTMARDGIGPEVLPVTDAVEAALLEAKDRYERTGRMGTTGEGLKAMRDLYDFHDLQRTAVHLSAYEQAIAKTARRIRSASPEVKELV